MRILIAAVCLRVALVGLYLCFSSWIQSSDIHFYHSFAVLSASGELPYLHFWMEYPPIFPFLAVGLYQLLHTVGLESSGYFYLGHALFMSTVDVGNLLLVHFLVKEAHGQRRAGYAALVYAGLPILVWYSIGWFDALAVLCMLGTLALILRQRMGAAGVALALGTMLKLFPAVLLLAALATVSRVHLARMVLFASGTIAIIIVPLLALRHDLLLASLGATLSREPWETIWALWSGSYWWGALPPLEQRFDPGTPLGTQSPPFGLAPVLLQICLMAPIVWFGVQMRRLDWTDARNVYALAALGILALLLGSKGFSPQFITWLVPLVLLVWPNPIGIAYLLGLSAYVADYYLYLADAVASMRTSLSLGEPQRLWLTVLVGVRMLLLAILMLHLLLSLRRHTLPAESHALAARSIRAEV